MSFLTILCLLGVIGLAVYLFLLQRKTESRIDALNNFLDALDEKLSHSSLVQDRKDEELKNRTTVIEEKIGQEKTQRDESIASLLQKAERLAEAVERTDMSVVRFTESLQETLTTTSLSLTEKIQKAVEPISNRLEEFSATVEKVASRNEIHLALEYLAAKKPEQASEILHKLVEQNPKSLSTRLLCIQADIQRGNLALATEVAGQGLVYHPENGDLQAARCQIYRLEKNRSERNALLATSLEAQPDHPGLLFERALFLIENHKYEDALRDLEKLQSQTEETAELRYNLGVAYVGIGDIPRAVAEFRKSLALDPVSADTNHSLGLALLHGERYREAVDFLERARDLLPSVVSIRLDLAMGLRLSGMAEEALRECAMARHLNPSILRTGIEEALTYQALGQYNESLACLDALLAKSPHFLRARRLRAELLDEAERHEEAAREWEQIVSLSPEDPYLHASWGQALKRAGDATGALNRLQIAAHMAINSAPIQLMLAREALAQHEFILAQEVFDRSYPRAFQAEHRVQLLEIHLLLTLLAGKWIALVPFIADQHRLLADHPEIIPLEESAHLDGQTILRLGMSKDAARIHSGWLDLMEGAIQISDFEELVTRVLKSLLPPRPATRPEPVEEEIQPPAPAPAPAPVPTPITAPATVAIKVEEKASPEEPEIDREEPPVQEVVEKETPENPTAEAAGQAQDEASQSVENPDRTGHSPAHRPRRRDRHSSRKGGKAG